MTADVQGSAAFKAIIFDLDGTLVDSLPDLAEAVNGLMAERGLPEHGRLAVAHMVGKGVRVLVQKAFAAHGIIRDGTVLDADVARYLELYEPRATRLTTLYPHVVETVRALAAGYRLGVCTNKPGKAAEDIVAALGLADIIEVVVGGDCGLPVKPAPDMMLLAARRLGVAPAEALMVGDSGNDVASAHAAGIKVALVRYGYTAVPADDLGGDHVMDDFRGLPEAIARLSAGR